ncbi:MAG: VOC family protein [Polyangiaceae bacterium]|nr:VOC family protein [Polyangiaceae bacterium]
MKPLNPTSLSLTSTWFIKPGREEEAIGALASLAEEVEANEPDTLIYLVHTPFLSDRRVTSLPPSAPGSVLFFEVYRNVDAFQRHVSGAIFTGFVRKHGDLFVSSDGSRFSCVQFLARRAGFIRGEVLGLDDPAPGNRHPAVMFEVIANDQEQAKKFYHAVFGWNYTIGTGNFAYVKFRGTSPALLGGIGQADDKEPGFSAGHSFYLLVDNVATALERAVNAGGKLLMGKTEIDGYTIAMFTDPDGNSVGLIEPFPPA